MDPSNSKNILPIILSVLLIGLGAGYYLSIKNKTIDTPVTQNASTPIDQSEIESLKQEIENLKNQKPQTIIKEVPAQIKNKPTAPDLSTIINQWRPSVAHIDCKWYSESEPRYLLTNAFGSGLLVKTLNNRYLIFTNKHIITDQWGNAPWTCTVRFPDSSESYIVNVNPNTRITDDIAIFPDLDVGEIFIRSPGPYVLSTAKVINFCTKRAVAGEQLVILGYPGIGSPTDVTATEGIISGYDGGYYITSAKVEHGSSGGAAISLKNNCYLGIPSYVSIGQLESLARILDYSYLNSLWSEN